MHNNGFQWIAITMRPLKPGVKCKNMIKRHLEIFVAVFLVISFPIVSNAQFIVVEFSKHNDTATGEMVYDLVFKRGDKIIAKRKYSIGKALLSEGEIPDGMVVEKYPDGKAKNIMFYKNGERNGPALSLYESGRIKSQAYYKDGMTTGKGYYYFESGALKTEWEIKDGKNLYHYEYTESGKRGRYRTADGKDVVD
jgi:antitoxin component YwqK of YwqJK toxin-antitoxin module